jgi:hypothetical protein
MTNEDKIREKIKQIRALVQASQARISTLRPAWNAHLAAETLRQLSRAVDELDGEISPGGVTAQASAQAGPPGSPSSG